MSKIEQYGPMGYIAGSSFEMLSTQVYFQIKVYINGVRIRRNQQRSGELPRYFQSTCFTEKTDSPTFHCSLKKNPLQKLFAAKMLAFPHFFTNRRPSVPQGQKRGNREETAPQQLYEFYISPLIKVLKLLNDVLWHVYAIFSKVVEETARSKNRPDQQSHGLSWVDNGLC